MNPNTGKRERIYVDLATLYPTPDVPGSELSFEEVYARNRGWLDQAWDDASNPDVNMQLDDENSPHAFADEHAASVDAMSRVVTEKLVIHRDDAPAMYDENGAVKEVPRGGKSKKIKRMEVNETQISEWTVELLFPAMGDG